MQKLHIRSKVHNQAVLAVDGFAGVGVCLGNGVGFHSVFAVGACVEEGADQLAPCDIGGYVRKKDVN